MAIKTSELVILPGYKCNFKCAHCYIPEKLGLEWTIEETRFLRFIIQKHSIKSLLFAGGEPTLYLHEINSILTGLPGLDKICIKITTNGHFADGEDGAINVLLKLRKITHLQLSYDK